MLGDLWEKDNLFSWGWEPSKTLGALGSREGAEKLTLVYIGKTSNNKVQL